MNKSIFKGYASQIESIENKTTEISENSTDTQYPSAAAVYKGFVAKENGKGLSTNDFTDEDKEKLGSALQADDISDKMDKFGTVELDGTRLGDVTASVKNFQLLNLTGESCLDLGGHEARLDSKGRTVISKLNTETGDFTEVAVGEGVVTLSKAGKIDVILNGVATPTDDNHGANKQYVDEAVAEAVGVANDYTDKAIKSLKTYANNTFAPAIKNTVSSSVLAVHDVSPVEHDLGVSVRSKNLLNPIEIKQVYKSTTNFDIYAENPLLLPSGTYTFKYYGSDVVHQLNIANSDTSTNIVLSYNKSVATFTLTEATHICISLYNINGFTEYGEGYYQLELGTTATEYTPYVADLSAVGVSRLGKNLAYINDFSISGTLNETTPLGGLKGSALVRNIPIINGESYRISMTKPDKVYAPMAFLHNTPMYAVAHNGMYATVVSGGDGIQISALNTVITNDNNYKYMSISIGNESGYTAGDVTINISDLQLECGITATDYEPYIEPQTVTANADGTVEGLTSLSPNITVTTDTDGVVIDMTYNADTKMYIDNKLAEISTAIVNNV